FHFDPEAAIQGGKGVLKKYLKTDGLAASNVVFRSSFKEQNGMLYFGSAAGFSYFDPQSIPENEHLPEVVFTELKVLNQVVRPSRAKGAILRKAINLTDTISLNYRQNVFSLQFAALDFANPSKNQYAHRLEGFDPEWRYTGNTHQVTYTNLSSGTYQLLVKGSNNDGRWNEVPTRLIIHVLPPPWKTPWAYALYLIGFGTLVYAFIRYRIQQKVQKIEQAAQIERVRFQTREALRKQNAADFHDELGHRLTRISLFMELAQREAQAQGSLQTYFHKIKANTLALSDGIRDLIWSLDPQKDSLSQTLSRLQEFGDQLFAHTTIKFKTEAWTTDLETIELEPDIRKHLLLIFKEAMNNSLKYAQATEVVLGIQLTDTQYQIYLQDDGIGFQPKADLKGYGLKNMQERAKQIGGVLKLDSQVGKGTQVSLTCSIRPRASSPERGF
ncbi:MAG: triple tyrosine motif-containing protein, partial [Bacteroidota bacterium]